MDETRWLDEREEGAWRALQFMQLRLTGRLAADVAATSDLSYSDYLVLVALSDQPDGRTRLFELAKALGWEKSRLSHQVARMSGRGLVKKGSPDTSVGASRRTFVRARMAVRPATGWLAWSIVADDKSTTGVVKGRAATRARPRLRRPLTTPPARHRKAEESLSQAGL